LIGAFGDAGASAELVLPLPHAASTTPAVNRAETAASVRPGRDRAIVDLINISLRRVKRG
jgi:hypothetical protein